MISKVYQGHSFYHACRYIVTKQGAEILYCEGVRSHDYKLMAEDFLVQQELRPGKEKACLHASLSFYPGERVSNEQMIRLAKEYLEKLGVKDTQVVLTKHTDREHPHVHIIANLVNNTGKSIRDSYIGLKGKKVAKELTQQYKLIPAHDKNLKLTNTAALRKVDAIRYKIYRAVTEVLPYAKTLTELEVKLKPQGIEIKYKYKRGTTQIEGISFKLGDHLFKGSAVDRQLSASNLQKTLAQSQIHSLQPLKVETKNQFLITRTITTKEAEKQVAEKREETEKQHKQKIRF